MNLKHNKTLNSGIWFTLSNFIVKSIGFITMPIFTRVLSKSEFGDFSNFTTWIGIFTIIVSLNLEASLIRARFDFEKDLDKYVFSMISLSTISTVIWYLIVELFKAWFEEFLSLNMTYINAIFVYLLFYPAVSLFQTAEKFKYKYKWTVAISMAIALSSSILSVVLVVNCNNKLFGRIVGYVLPYVIVGMGITIFYLKCAKRLNLRYWKYALPVTLPFIPHLLSMLLLGSMDRIMIRQLCGPEDTALYSLAYSCGTMISLLVTSINNAFSPWLGEQLSQSNYLKIRKVGTPYAITFSYIACGVVLLTPEILMILGGSNYIEAKYVMPPVAVGCILQFLYCMYVNVEQFEKRTVGMAVASVFAAILNYVLNLFFIKKYGYIAAAYTTYVGYFSLLVMHMWLVKKIDRGDVYDNRIIGLIALAVSCFMGIANVLFNYNLLRYLFICIYGVVGILAVITGYEKLKRFL